MSPADIRSFMSDPNVERLDEHERQVADEFAERRRVLRYVKRVLKEEPMYDVFTKSVPETTYVSRSRRVLVPELTSFICSAFDELGQSGDGPSFVLYHGPVNAEEDGPVEVCVPKTEGQNRLPAGPSTGGPRRRAANPTDRHVRSTSMQPTKSCVWRSHSRSTRRR